MSAGTTLDQIRGLLLWLTMSVGLALVPIGYDVLVAGQTKKPAAPAAKPGLKIEISFPASAHAGPITGRVFFMLSRKGEPEPRFQIGRTGVPFFGRDIERLEPGQPAIIDESDLGTPVESLRDIPPGDYFVQAFVNRYTEFPRADGHRVWMHEDQWEGQRWQRSPGNLYSDVERVHLDARAGGMMKLVAKHVIPPIQLPADTESVKRFRFQSPSLTKFWGRPIYLGATVLLPRDYATSTISYPVNYIQGHFSLAPPLNLEGNQELAQAWMSDEFPRLIAVTFQHPTPYFDDSYAVNSVNVGPYGDAIMQELIPEVEKRFRVIRAPYARILSGGSTGGWESLALQIFHPDFFGGTWSYCPDPVTFSDVEGINIYEDENAYYKRYGWRTVFTPNSRETDGQIRLTSRQRNYFELVNGTNGRSGEQIDIWSAVFGPLGEDGYFEPLFDKKTGVIHESVAQYWREHFDLLSYLQRNWASVGPKLVDKLHVYTGDMDTYYLNNSTRELDKWMKTTANPHDEGFFLYGDGKPHCWSGPVSQAERLKEIAQYIMYKKPDGATTPWWRY
ncbi:MAG: hypothetical protein HYZ58_08015 [Acidobacteria bacterium]|nr:hypothetical protein [Acidobacteriota bacterium]MBI3263081.1 hypothetical protein [Acidobacteriota bacterium]